MDSDRFTYVWVHQFMFSKFVNDANHYSRPRGGVIFFDKQNPEAGFRGIHERASGLSGAELRAAAYNPRGKYLVMVYTDGGIDILTDNGEIRNISELKDSSVPFDMQITNISFPIEDDDTWIATKSGFIHISGSGFSISGYCSGSKPVQAINRVGNNIIAIVNARFYIAPVDSPLFSLEQMTPLDISGLVSPEVILPAGNNSFITLDNDGEGPGNRISLVSLDTTPCSVQHIFSDKGFSNQMHSSGPDIRWDMPIALHNENNIIPTDEGYLIFSDTQAYNISKSLDNDGMPLIYRKQFHISSPKFVGSGDFENFWFYDRRRGFHCDRASGDGDNTVWEVGELIPYSGPAAAAICEFTYSPNHGLIVTNKGHFWDVEYYNVSMVPALVAGLKNGKWTDYSPCHNMPRFCEKDEMLRSCYLDRNLSSSVYPLMLPRLPYIDPIHSGYIWFGSERDGIAALNLDDIKAPALQFAEPENRNNLYPGFKGSFPTLNDWAKPFCVVFPAGFDAESRLWCIFLDYNMFGREGINFYYLNAEDRSEGLLSGDIKDFGEWKNIFYPCPGIMMHPYAIPKVLRHPRNATKIAVADGSSRGLLIFDHKGTLDDTSDDTLKKIHKVMAPDGEIYTWHEIRSMNEDPVTGNIILGTIFNVLSFDPDMPVTDGMIKGELLSLHSPDGTSTPAAPFQMVQAIEFDEYNRMWLGIHNGGIIGINAERTDIIARYNTLNSPLCHDNVYGLGWNPDTKELMVSTITSLCSVKPDIIEMPYSVVDPRPFAIPASVNPDFAGVVTIYNIRENVPLSVLDSDGRFIASLNPSPGKINTWNLQDKDGRMVKSGTYTITDFSGRTQDVIVKVLR